MDNFYLVLFPETNDNKFNVKFESPLTIPSTCGLFDVNLAEIEAQTPLLSVQLVYCNYYYESTDTSPEWYSNEHIIQQFDFKKTLNGDIHKFYQELVVYINEKLFKKTDIFDVLVGRKEVEDTDIDNYAFFQPKIHLESDATDFEIYVFWFNI